MPPVCFAFYPAGLPFIAAKQRPVALARRPGLSFSIVSTCARGPIFVPKTEHKRPFRLDQQPFIKKNTNMKIENLPRASAQPTVRRKRWKAPLIGVAVLALAAGGWYGLRAPAA